MYLLCSQDHFQPGSSEVHLLHFALQEIKIKDMFENYYKEKIEFVLLPRPLPAWKFICFALLFTLQKYMLQNRFENYDKEKIEYAVVWGVASQVLPAIHSLGVYFLSLLPVVHWASFY